MTVTNALLLLDLEDEPSDALVKKTYRALAAIVHPDRHKNNPTASQLFRRYKEARDALLAVPEVLRRRVTGPSHESRSSSQGRSSQDSHQPGYGWPPGSGTGGAWPPGFDPSGFRAYADDLADFAAEIGREASRGSRAAQVILAGTMILTCGLVLKLVQPSSR